MPIQKRAPCQICHAHESKYTCAQCRVIYCSIPCYKEHKSTSCHQTEVTSVTPSTPVGDERDTSVGEESMTQTDALAPPDLRPLTSLKWPYIPEESAYPDPLKRDDPKPLQLHHYETIATSPAIRKTLAAHPQLRGLLRSIDKLRGRDREDALERALGVSSSSPRETSEKDIQALRELAEAVEAAVRGGKEDALGLDWGD